MFTSTCWECGGRIPTCERCLGTNVVQHRRCPRASTDSDALAAVSAYSWLDRFSVTPVPGGMLDQHPRFVEMVRIVDIERSEIDRAKEEDAQARARMAASAANRKG